MIKSLKLIKISKNSHRLHLDEGKKIAMNFHPIVISEILSFKPLHLQRKLVKLPILRNFVLELSKNDSRKLVSINKHLPIAYQYNIKKFTRVLRKINENWRAKNRNELGYDEDEEIISSDEYSDEDIELPILPLDYEESDEDIPYYGYEYDYKFDNLYTDYYIRKHMKKSNIKIPFIKIWKFWFDYVEDIDINRTVDRISNRQDIITVLMLEDNLEDVKFVLNHRRHKKSLSIDFFNVFILSRGFLDNLEAFKLLKNYIKFDKNDDTENFQIFKDKLHNCARDALINKRDNSRQVLVASTHKTSNYEWIEILLDDDNLSSIFDINRPDTFNNTFLYRAVYHDDLETVKYLLNHPKFKHIIDIGYVIEAEYTYRWFDSHKTVMFDVVAYNKINILTEILKSPQFSLELVYSDTAKNFSLVHLAKKTKRWEIYEIFTNHPDYDETKNSTDEISNDIIMKIKRTFKPHRKIKVKILKN